MTSHTPRSHDTRAVHRAPAGPRVRYFGKNESSTSIQQPFGQVAPAMAGALSRQQISPLVLGLGLGTGRRARRLQKQIESGEASGPLADAIQSIQQFAPNVLPAAQAQGERIAREGEAAVGSLQDTIRQAQGALPRYQQAADKGLSATQGALGRAQQLSDRAMAQLPGLEATSARGLAGIEEGLGAARGALGRAQANMPALEAAAAQGLTGAQEALNLARGYTTGPAIGGAQGALELAQRYAQRAASPIGDEDLYQQAARRVMQQVRPGLAARGLEGGGGGAQLETDAMRNLTFDFAQRRAAEQQQTVQSQLAAAQGLGGLQQAALGGFGTAASGVQEAAGRSAALPSTLLPLIQGVGGAGTSVQEAAARQGALGQSMLPYLQAIQQGSAALGTAAGQGAQLSQMGVPLAQQGVSAVQQLGQALAQQYGIPMQQAGQLLNLLTSGQQPGISLLGATGPIATPSSKGMRII